LPQAPTPTLHSAFPQDFDPAARVFAPWVQSPAIASEAPQEFASQSAHSFL